MVTMIDFSSRLASVDRIFVQRYSAQKFICILQALTTQNSLQILKLICTKFQIDLHYIFVNFPQSLFVLIEHVGDNKNVSIWIRILQKSGKHTIDLAKPKSQPSGRTNCVFMKGNFASILIGNGTV